MFGGEREEGEDMQRKMRIACLWGEGEEGEGREEDGKGNNYLAASDSKHCGGE